MRNENGIQKNGQPDDAFQVFQDIESAVRSYCRRFPAVFATARNAVIEDEQGRQYIDFLAGAGALNYGHNNPKVRDRLVEYLMSDGIAQSLDLHTSAKKDFLRAFQDVILAPRGFDYRVQFTGPTGTNAVEAALKLARKVTGRRNVVAFTNAFHGMTLASLAATARASKRAAAGVSLHDVIRMPYDGFLGEDMDSMDVLEAMLFGPGSGVDLPAAIILETVQAEGGINVASPQWLARVAALARKHEVLLIVDDIQAGCGRTGAFFSFERAGIQPDLVCLSKSISGYGLPMSLVLIRPHLDCWEPGEHNGTFRGNNLAFVAATSVLDYWRDQAFSESIARKSRLVGERLRAIRDTAPAQISAVRGLGLLQGLVFNDPQLANAVSKAAFERGLIVELCGPAENVVKLMPPLLIEDDVLADGLSRLAEAVRACMNAAADLTLRLDPLQPVMG
ncbi:diaminobutyrate--2-oxoglutarate transaminase [Agrilutibacter solisilvae]|uniref:Diaminobutyrate--2-oxoglutarate transaminase n=1 Tax=Agrilutibacter solisilvae TaxID=2763317 RepID=A0A974Y1C9_9GAMM|nr:diaminobutyrate--2-oxoglutarate transaminase [Lysobacter solisilvae]QSX79622.1 diaminobutyrate--2-oxoglutarate transaminase [Lysobacter solisilvae]